ARDQAGLLQHLKVARDGRLGHRERRGELHHRSLAAGEAREDRPARRIGESGEGGVEAIGSQVSITPFIYNSSIIYTCRAACQGGWRRRTAMRGPGQPKNMLVRGSISHAE